MLYARFYSFGLLLLLTNSQAIAGCGIFSRMTSYYGRKPVFLIVLAAGSMNSCMTVSSQYLPGGLADCLPYGGVVRNILWPVDRCSSGYRCVSSSCILNGPDPELKNYSTKQNNRLGRARFRSGLLILQFLKLTFSGTYISYALGGSLTTKQEIP